MTNSIYFDTDCISAFLWVKQEHLLVQLFPEQLRIPLPVYQELSNPRIHHLKDRLDEMINKKEVQVVDIVLGTQECDLYFQLTIHPRLERKLIGKGEGASIALAKKAGGIVASNNLHDILAYIEEYQLQHITTSDILVMAYQKKLLKKKEVNTIWTAMRQKRRQLGADTFDEYLKSKKLMRG